MCEELCPTDGISVGKAVSRVQETGGQLDGWLIGWLLAGWLASHLY